MLYIAMSGARQTLVGQTMAAHNLANATTTGYRADLADFRSMPLFGPGQPSRVYAMAERPTVDFRSGSIVFTGNETDLAINGEGFIAVQGPDGTEAYTRAGDLRVTTNGLLETGAGHLVLGNGGPISVPPATKMEIGVDGTISIVPVGQPANALAEVDRIKLVKPALDTLEKGIDGLFRLKNGAPPPADAIVRVVPGALESSNVNAVDAMVRMINLSRQFDLQVKAMKTAEDDDAAAAQILRMN
jgi:flagellar basal-body rod protein FlgF